MLLKKFWKRGQNVIILKSGYGLVTRKNFKYAKPKIIQARKLLNVMFKKIYFLLIYFSREKVFFYKFSFDQYFKKLLLF